MTVVQILASYGMEIVASVVMTFVAALLRKYVKNKALADTLNEAAVNGVAYAEEWARKKLKTGAEVTGESKLEQALAYVLKELEDAGYKKMAEDKLIKLIEAKLGAERANPMGVVPSDEMVEVVDVSEDESN